MAEGESTLSLQGSEHISSQNWLHIFIAIFIVFLCSLPLFWTPPVLASNDSSSHLHGATPYTSSIPSGSRIRTSSIHNPNVNQPSKSSSGATTPLVSESEAGESDAATPLVSEQENDIDPRLKAKRKAGNAKRSRRRLKQRVTEWERHRLILLQKMGFNIDNTPVQDLPPARIKQLADKFCLRPKDIHR
ncbi:hypothetical protein FRC12_018722, partial [Ceratobasidium sp. 428]